jgi:dTDP-4-amino-4,6-dideoxygalactose transaminase
MNGRVVRVPVRRASSILSTRRVVPFSRPSIGEEEIDEVVRCLRSGWITTGPLVERFEKEFAAYVGAPHALAVSSATAGLHLAMLALDLQPGDEVITSPMTWPATVNAILFGGGTPVFADIEPDSLNLDVTAVARKLGPRTRAILPVHFAGQPCDVDELVRLGAPGRIAVVEDAAHAIGTELRGHRVGGLETDAAVFSFHPIKNITTAEGGMVTTANTDMARRLRLFRFHGVDRDAWKAYGASKLARYDVVVPGFKYNLTDLQAALGVHQLAKLGGFLARRARLARRYDDAFADIPEIRPLGHVTYPHRHAHHLYVVRLATERLTVDRDGFMAELQAAGVNVGLHFTAVHGLTYYREKLGDFDGDLPVATDVSRRIFSLPLFPSLAEEDQDYVIDVVRRTARARRR